MTWQNTGCEASDCPLWAGSSLEVSACMDSEQCLRLRFLGGQLTSPPMALKIQSLICSVCLASLTIAFAARDHRYCPH